MSARPLPGSPSLDSSLLDSQFSQFERIEDGSAVDPVVVEDTEEPLKFTDVPGSPVKLVQSSRFR